MIVALSLMEKLGIENYTLRINDLIFLRTYLEEQQIQFDMQNKIFGVIDKVASLMRKLEIGALPESTETELIDTCYGMINDLQIDRDLAEKLENLLHLVGKT